MEGGGYASGFKVSGIGATSKCVVALSLGFVGFDETDSKLGFVGFDETDSKRS